MPRGTDISGLGISAVLASEHGRACQVPCWRGVIGFLGAWILFKTQLDIIEAWSRSITDMLWTGSRARPRVARRRRARGLLQRACAIVVWGIIALRLAQPIVLLKISANVAGVVFIVAIAPSALPEYAPAARALRPPLWRRAALVCMAAFYSVFVGLSLLSVMS